MKYIKLSVLSILFACLCTSCEDFLDVQNYTGIPADEAITSVDNAQLALNGVYNALYGQSLYYFGIYFYMDISSGELHCLKTDEEINPFEEFRYYDSFKYIENYWKDLYSLIARANDVCTKIYELRNSGTLTEAENAKLNQMIGECNFLRGFGYFFLTRSFGDMLPSHPNYDPNALGVPIVDTLVVSKEQLLIPRNTLSECWSEIIRNFETAYRLLPESWPTEKLGAVRKGAAAGYLGQVYMYLKDYDTAKRYFQEVIDDNARYALVEDYTWNFDAYHENNSESVFEVQFQTTLDYTILSSYLWRRLGPDNVAGGFGMVGVPNEWVEKFSTGYELTQSVYDAMISEIDELEKPTSTQLALREVVKAYQGAIGHTVLTPDEFFNLVPIDWDALGAEINQIRREYKYRENVLTESGWGTVNSTYVQTILNNTRAADPRMYDSFYCPGVDWLASEWQGEKDKPYPNSYYGFKKYIPYDAPATWTEGGQSYAEGFNCINQRIYRLADLYLQYAEVCHRTGDDNNAIKYLNKVRRRAWGFPFDDASLATRVSVDYPIDADESAEDFIDVIMAEREKELSLEGVLWFDYLRLNWLFNKTGFKETYEERGFDASKNHRFPLPLSERQIVGMDVLLQNSGY